MRRQGIGVVQRGRWAVFALAFEHNRNGIVESNRPGTDDACEAMWGDVKNAGVRQTREGACDE